MINYNRGLFRAKCVISIILAFVVFYLMAANASCKSFNEFVLFTSIAIVVSITALWILWFLISWVIRGFLR